MEYFIIKSSLILFFIIMMIYTQINSFYNSKCENDILHHGQHLIGKVEKINYRLLNRSFARKYNCTPIVSFIWEGSIYTLKTINTTPYGKYSKGSDIELLYLSKYPQKVIIKDEEGTSVMGVFFDTIMFLFLASALVIAAINI